MSSTKVRNRWRRFGLPRIVRPFRVKENISLRDFLALERTTLANERTLFSYIRTSLYLILGGIALIQLEEVKQLHWLGYVALGISAFLIVYGLIRFVALKQKLRRFYNAIDRLPDAETGTTAKVLTGKTQV